MRATVSSCITFDYYESHPKVFGKLKQDLSFINPDYVKRKRMGLYLDDTPQKIEILVERDGQVMIPRGAVDLLKKRVEQCGEQIEFIDERIVHDLIQLKADLTLRPYQQQAVAAMCRHPQGVIVMPCGGGKTITATAAIVAIGQPTLVIVHTKDLLNQWKDVLENILHIKVGIVAEGKCDIQTVTIATVQTLIRLPEPRFKEIARAFGCVILDEAHHTPSNTFQQVISNIPAKYRYGLTATPEREDGLSRLIDFTFGSLLFEIGYPELMAGGWLEKPEVKEIQTDFRFDYTSPKDLQPMMKALLSDPLRNKLIAEIAIREAKAGHHILLLSDRVAHCNTLAELISNTGVTTEILIGKVAKTKRKIILQDFRDGKISVLVASTLADEGLDVPILDRVILAWPGCAKGRTTQRLGRIMRPHRDKSDSILYDIVDGHVPLLKRRFYQRRKAYASLGLCGGIQ